MEEVLRELSDTELDAVSGGAAAAAATTSGGLSVAVVGGALVNFTPILHLFSKWVPLIRHGFLKG
jgi:bacteriocin-like protein